MKLQAAPSDISADPSRQPEVVEEFARTSAVDGGSRHFLDEFRAELLAELEAMARHLLSSGGHFDAETVEVLRRIEDGEKISITDLTLAHGNLSTLIAPATPRAIRSLQDGARAQGLRVMLGPSPPVRRLTMASLLFALLFFGVSLSPNINHEMMALSLYELHGPDLLIKLLFLMAAAGLGASFGALFEIWQEIAEGRFDPITESAHWMRIGLGLIAGLVLSELVRTESDPEVMRNSAIIAEPMLALLGGFSARLLHLIVTRLVNAIESTFEPLSRRRSEPTRTLGNRPALPSAPLHRPDVDAPPKRGDA